MVGLAATGGGRKVRCGLETSANGPARRIAAALVLLALLVFVGIAGACSGGADTTEQVPVGQRVEVPGGSFVRISPEELQAMLREKDFPLINVHIPYEGEIEGTDQHIPYNQIGQRLADLPADKNAKIVIYCRSGNMSTQAAAELVKAGYTNIYELAGGMLAWKAAGLPLVEG